MKRKFTTLLLIILGINNGFSQEFDKNLRTTKRNVSVEQGLKNYQSDMEFARLNNIPTTFEGKDGSISELVYFTNGMPVYYKGFNAQSANMMGANRIYPGGDMGLNLTGTNVRLGVWDQNHPLITHVGFSGGLQPIDSPTPGAPISLHHTHVLGTVGSSGEGSVNFSGRGIAYGARLNFASWTSDLDEMQGAVGAPYRVISSNHSYGFDLEGMGFENDARVEYFGKYIQGSRDWDTFCFNNPNYSVVIAAGNDRDSFTLYNSTKAGNDLLTDNGVSKNPIVVGAVNGFNSYTGPSSVVMSEFSNFGPTDDFRIKPDIVAKGVNVYSTTNNTNNTSYGPLDGTSMAAPAVTGAIGLLRNFYGASNFQKASRIKGLLLHTALEAGEHDGPDHKFGWGQINIAEAVYTAQITSRSEVLDLTYRNASQTYNISAIGNEPLKVSISWTDPAGTADNSSQVDISTPKLVDDLDIRLTQNGTTYSPWYLTKNFANPLAARGDNNVDPFERIDVDNPSGVYQLTISNKGTVNNRDFTLIVTGGKFVTNSLSDLNSNKMVSWVDASNVLNIDASNIDSSLQFLEVYDLSGRLIKKVVLNSNRATIDMSGFSKGYYIMNVFDNQSNRYSDKIYVK